MYNLGAMLARVLARLKKSDTSPEPESPSPRRLSARQQHRQDGQATQARLSARYAALLETAGRIWELRKAEQRREEIFAIVEEMLEDAGQDLRAYAYRRMARSREKLEEQPAHTRRFDAWRRGRRGRTREDS